MSNTGQIDSNVKSPAEIKIALLSMRYFSSDLNTKEVCTEAARLIIDQQLRLDAFEKELATAEQRIATLESQKLKIFKIVSNFNGGLTPTGYDGEIVLKVDEYNALVNAINSVE